MTELDNLLTLGFKVVAAPGPSLPVGGPCGDGSQELDRYFIGRL